MRVCPSQIISPLNFSFILKMGVVLPSVPLDFSTDHSKQWVALAFVLLLSLLVNTLSIPYPEVSLERRRLQWRHPFISPVSQPPARSLIQKGKCKANRREHAVQRKLGSVVTEFLLEQTVLAPHTGAEERPGEREGGTGRWELMAMR